MSTVETTTVPEQTAIPLATGLPFVGSVFALANDSQQFLYNQYLKLGNIFRVRALGNEFKVLAGPEINLMLAQQAECFTAWNTWEPVVRDFGGRRTLTMLDGPDHIKLRKLMRQSFSKFALMANIPPIVELVQSSLKKLPLDTPVPVTRFVQRLTADQLGLLSNERTPGEYFDDIVFWWNSLLHVYVSHLKPEKTLQKDDYVRARGRVKDFARSVMESRKAQRAADGITGNDDEDNFIDNLAKAVEADSEFMTEDEALFMTMAAYFAGLDTVANVSSFMIYELLRHSEILERAKAEADAFFADGMPTQDSFDHLDVIHRAAMETLRLYPIAGVLPRNAAQDFTFAGHPFQKGDFFMIATCATHFAPQYFRNPGEFDIERYAPPRNEHKARGVYAPFGAGPHTCLGAGLAEVQIALTMATLLHTADFTFASPNYRLKRAYTPSLTPKGLAIKINGWNA